MDGEYYNEVTCQQNICTCFIDVSMISGRWEYMLTKYVKNEYFCSGVIDRRNLDTYLSNRNQSVLQMAAYTCTNKIQNNIN